MVVRPVRFSCGKIKAEKLGAGRYTAKKTLIREKRRGQKDSDRSSTFYGQGFHNPGRSSDRA
jgi:hypothetical protein